MLPFLTSSTAPEAAQSVLAFFFRSPWGVLALWLIIINLVTFFIFGVDKGLSKKQGARRVPEKNLFLLAVVGGSIGAIIGVRAWHHKTLHRAFRIGLPIILLIQIIIPVGLFIYWNFIR